MQRLVLSGHRARLWRFPEIRGRGDVAGEQPDPWVETGQRSGEIMGLKDHVIRFSHI